MQRGDVQRKIRESDKSNLCVRGSGGKAGSVGVFWGELKKNKVCETRRWLTIHEVRHESEKR